MALGQFKKVWMKWANHQAACWCVVCSEGLKACMLGSFLAELLESDASSQ
jgi:hypothetical protein